MFQKKTTKNENIQEQNGLPQQKRRTKIYKGQAPNNNNHITCNKKKKNKTTTAKSLSTITMTTSKEAILKPKTIATKRKLGSKEEQEGSEGQENLAIRTRT